MAERDRPPLLALAVCRHCDDEQGGGHTFPTVVDLWLAKQVFWPFAMWLYHRTKLAPLAAARACAFAGLVYFPAEAIVSARDWFDRLFVPASFLLAAFVIARVRDMRQMHDRIAGGEQPTLEDADELYHQRFYRITAVFVVPTFLLPGDLIGLGAWIVFVIWPLYACCIGAPPGTKLRDKIAEGARRLRALLGSLGPKPVLGGAPA